jgi:hypothetical protein
MDPATRTVLEEGPARLDVPVDIAGRRGGDFVELFARSTFSGISIDGVAEGFARASVAWPGSGTPDQLVERAAVVHADAPPAALGRCLGRWGEHPMDVFTLGKSVSPRS